MGFKVRWELIELDPDAGTDDSVTKQTGIVEPEPGMVVLSVLGPNGEGDSVDPFTGTLDGRGDDGPRGPEQFDH